MYSLDKIYYTGFPLAHKVLPDGYLEDFTLMAPNRILWKSINGKVITLSHRSTGATYCTTTLTDNSVCKFKDTNGMVVGYIKVAKVIQMYATINVEVISNINYYVELPTTGTVDFIDNEKYIPRYSSGVLQFDAAVYCGDTRTDAIYRINGVTGPDITIATKGWIYLKSDLNFDSTLQDVLCERDGIQGPKGERGPQGKPGKDGQNAEEIYMNFEGDC